MTLRDLAYDDHQIVYALSQKTAVTRYQTWLRLSNESSALKWVENAIHRNSQQPRDDFNLALAHAHSGEAIGWTGWGRPSDRLSGDYDFGYALHPSAWGRGYMTEALSAAVKTIALQNIDHRAMVNKSCAHLYIGRIWRQRSSRRKTILDKKSS